MVNVGLLQKKIDDSGMTMVAISNKADIVRETLYNRLAGIGEFTASEIMGISSALNLSRSEREAIFFAKKVQGD